jgi:hypothetical protein
MPDADLRPENPHPPEWQRDLNPDFLAGQNFTVGNADAGQDWPTAYDVKKLHRVLSEILDDDELAQVPVLPPGTRLEQGAIYLDLRHRPAVPFTATANMEAGPGNWYVPKAPVDYRIWNRLIGVQNPARLDESA